MINEKALRSEIEGSINIWTNLLKEEFGDKLRTVYVKGSSIKPWESKIDYVPGLSDVDMHFSIEKTDENDINKIVGFETAVKISEKYEVEFKKQFPNYIHLPRFQLMELDKLKSQVTYVPPRSSEIRMIVGEYNPSISMSDGQIKKIDRTNLLRMQEILNTTPMKVIDRSEKDYWTLLRKLAYEVSPAPFRLMTQLSDEPSLIWSLNREQITNKLVKNGYTQLADLYIHYYEKGWKLFESDYQSTKLYREIISLAWKLLNHTFEAISILK